WDFWFLIRDSKSDQLVLTHIVLLIFDILFLTELWLSLSSPDHNLRYQSDRLFTHFHHAALYLFITHMFSVAPSSLSGCDELHWTD
uniref:Uncharacterized protein n=1 Tax=Labrus bergylta TaxID=56723 RepID=A0A3Q3G5Z3_9LABR